MATTDTPKKIDFGPQTEDDVQHFVEHAFSADFVFRSPQRLDRGKEHETTDVFALFDDIALPIEVKSQAYNADGSPRVEDQGWTRKNLAKAVSQLKGAVRTIKAGQIVRLENARRGPVQFSTDMFRYVYALAVLNHVSAPFDAAELVPEIADFGVPLHVLSFVDFYNIARVLDTPSDLVGYLEVRSQILIPTFNPKVYEEQPVFEFYLDHFEELTSFHAKLHGEQRSPEGFKEHAEILRRIYRDGKIDIDASYFIDKIIDCSHETDASSPSPFENAERDYVTVATYLGRLTRSRRAYIGTAFLEAIKRAGETNEDEFAHFSSQLRDECLFFIASHRGDEQRKERNEDLFRYLWFLKTTRQVKVAMGIVIEAGFGKGRSFDFIVLDGDPQDNMSRLDYDEIKRLGDDFFGTVIVRPA
jgi:hypothetical protein